MNKDVVSLKLAIALKETGYPQEGIFEWWLSKRTLDYNVIYGKAGGGLPSHVWQKICVAPISSELGEYLPIKLKSNYPYKNPEYSSIECYKYYEPIEKKVKWAVRYLHIYITIAYTEADARAKMYLYLKGKGLI